MEGQKRNILVIGKKVGMTQRYDAAGALMPVSVVEVCEASVASVGKAGLDGVSAVVFGFFTDRKRKISTRKNSKQFGKLKGLRVDDASAYEVGSDVSVGEFAKGDLVDVIGTTKGRGFQGVMKRHNFAGGPAAHGSMFHRRGGSYGQRQWPGHVFRGRKMPGHYGDVRRTVQNLEVIDRDEERRLLVIKGSLPGSRGRYVIVRRAKKSS
jgi:large subunit ribosomal protein L3